MPIKFNHPAPGQFIAIRGKHYEILRHRIEWSESGITAETDIREVDDEGCEIDNWEMQINLDMHDYSVL